MLKARIKQKAVKSILLYRNISQNNLALRLHISSGYMSQLLAGVRYPSPRLRSRLLKELKVDFDTIFEVVNKKEAEKQEAKQ